MQIGRKAFAGARAGRTARSVRTKHCANVQRVSCRKSTVHVQAIFGNLFAPSGASSSAKAEQLVEDLLDLASKRVPAAEIETLVKDLQPLSIKAPVRSRQLFGEYKLVYSSKPGAASTKQILEEPDVIREVSSTASFLSSSTTTLVGTLDGIDNNTYQENFERSESKGLLGVESKPVDIAREVSILYLDANVRIVRVNDGKSESLAIYQRVTDEPEAEPEAESAPQKQGTGFVLPFGSPAREGTATIAEREVRKKMAAQEARKSASPAPRMASPAPAAPAARAGTAKVGTQGVDRSADAKRKEAEAAARAKDAAAAKEKAAAIKSQIEELSADLKEAQAEARNAAKEAKDLERANGVVLKQVATARLQLRSAAEDVEGVQQDIAKASEARAAAEAALKQALAELNAAQSNLKAVSGRK